MATLNNHFRHNEAADKENVQKGVLPSKKDKTNG